jgi:uroporphyrinogen-III synthase
MDRIWVTRDEMPDGPLCAALRAAGLEPVCEPVVERRAVADVTGEVTALGEEDWLVLTSPYAIERIKAGALCCRLAVVGEASRRAAEARGWRVALTAGGTGADLWSSLEAREVRGRRILFPRSSLSAAPPALAGAIIHAPVLYETRARAFDVNRVRDVAAAVVASPSAVSAIFGAGEGARTGGGGAAVGWWLLRVRFASIGPTTTGALRAAGVEPWVEAAGPEFRALALQIAGTLTAERKELRQDPYSWT